MHTKEAKNRFKIMNQSFIKTGQTTMALQLTAVTAKEQN